MIDTNMFRTPYLDTIEKILTRFEWENSTENLEVWEYIDAALNRNE